MKFAYADPPYPGQSWRLYGTHDDYAGEVDHEALIAQLVEEFPDGWALSTSAAALHEVLPLCPQPVRSRKNKGRYLQGTGTRVLVWGKKHAPWRPVGIQFAWEPILLYGGRPRDPQRWLKDYMISGSTTNTLVGAKPPEFCAYLFDALGAEPDDEFVDLFPGSGGVAAAYESWRSQGRLVT